MKSERIDSREKRIGLARRDGATRRRIASALAGLAAASLLVPGPAAGVVLTNADGVIRNSLCVGFDCPNNPSFSDTTILLMENNTRIKFDDTSVLAAFPNNDWELEANSSVNGGPNRFALNDCGNSSQGGCAEDPVFAVEAAVRTNALYVESDGDVGIGTSNPVGDVHILTGNSPFLRLDQDASSGFTPQSWDVGGNEANFFVRDVTMGSRLPLRIQPGASTNSIFINSTGRVGMGTSAPTEALHVARTDASATKVLLTNSNAATQTISYALDNNAANAPDGWEFRVNAGGNFQITENGTGVQEFQINGVTGDVTINGSLSKGGGGFKIDHPLDPENRYLEHSFVESPEMLNVYDGRTVLDREGRAVVTLPEWFEALNRDYRYQLTPIGAPAVLWVAREIAGGSFEIAGGRPGQTVTWQVTGVRRDAWAEAHRIRPESLKPQEERGAYLHPVEIRAQRERAERLAAGADGDASDAVPRAAPR